jgi:hypothetical protein
VEENLWGWQKSGNCDLISQARNQPVTHRRPAPLPAGSRSCPCTSE